MKVTIRVTQDDIDMAEATGGPDQQQVYRYCPDAVACNRDLLYAHPELLPGVSGIEVIATYAMSPQGWLLPWNGGNVIAHLPIEEVNRIWDWDNGNGMEPHDFEIEVQSTDD